VVLFDDEGFAVLHAAAHRRKVETKARYRKYVFFTDSVFY